MTDQEKRRPEESEAERLDRNLMELVNEVRVALPGVQVLFAFLLTVPFSQRFTELTRTQERIYYGTLLCTAVATAFLIAPSAHHRLQFRARDKRHIVFTANKLVIVGLTFLALAMTGAMLLVTDFIFSAAAATITTAAAALLFGWLWYVMPLLRRFQRR